MPRPFYFYRLSNSGVAAGYFSDLADLAQWFDLFDGFEDEAVQIEEIDDGEQALEVAFVRGRPMGTLHAPASAKLLQALEPRRFTIERSPYGVHKSIAYSAYDADSYDGPGSAMGWGETPAEAVADCAEQLIERSA